MAGRFHFFAPPVGGIVPVLYGSDRDEGAVAETVFHDAPVKGRLRTVQESRLARASITTLRPERDLRLVELLGFGLRRLEITPQELTDTPPTKYPRTVPWAEALHREVPDADGLVWMSKQFNAAKALVLFGDRVRPGELSVIRLPLPLLVSRDATWSTKLRTRPASPSSELEDESLRPTRLRRWASRLQPARVSISKPLLLSRLKPAVTPIARGDKDSVRPLL